MSMMSVLEAAPDRQTEHKFINVIEGFQEEDTDNDQKKRTPHKKLPAKL